MQNLDPSGQYTDAEVKAALSGAGGSRKWSFRYARLDSKNNYIEDIDYIQSCTINNDFLADIKRTAKFNILDTGSLNYLSDRIKPYVRLNMPADVAYTDYLSQLQPSVWWKFDDAVQAPATTGTAAVAAGTTFATSATADLVDLTVNSARAATMQLASGTLRPEYWSYINTSPVQAIQIEMKNTGTADILCEIYTANTNADQTTLIRSVYLTPGKDLTYGYPLPSKGVYLVRAVPQTAAASSVTVTYYKASRLEDSSGHGVYGFGNNLGLQSPGVVQDGGYGLKVNAAANSWGTDTQAVTITNGMTVNYWVSQSNVATDIEVYSEWGANSGVFKFYLNDDAVNGTYAHDFKFVSYDTTKYPNFTSTVSIPAGVMSANTPHMFTVAVDPVRNTANLYIDGKPIGSFSDSGGAQLSTLLNVFTSETLNYNSSFTYADNAVTIDDYSILPVALNPTQATTLYQKGTSPVTKRSGYVEWPQGVFLLSSPKRTMVDGNMVVRQVDAYDQLLVLKEDSFDVRTAFAAGTKYTDAIKRILLGVMPVGPVTIDSNWSLGLSGTSSPDSNAYATPIHQQYVTTTSNSTTWNFPNTSTFSDTGVYSRNLPMALGGFSMSAKVSPPNNVAVSMNAYVYGNTPTNSWISMEVDTGQLFMAWDGNNSAQLAVPYNAVAHAYIRMRESGNKIIFETSPDGVSWVTQLVAPNAFRLNSYIQTSFEGMTLTYSGTSTPVTASCTNIVMSASNAATLRLVENAAIMPAAMEWEAGVPKIQALNDLLAAINYESGWFDENGDFRARPYISPTVRASEFRYATDASSVITGNVDQTIDLFKIPNKWVLVVSEPDRPVITSTYVNSSPTSPTSTIARGRIITDVRKEQTAVDQATLDGRVARLAFEASQVYEAIDFTTGLMPMHSNNDVYTLHIDGLSVDNKYSETSWSMDLNPGAAMKHTVRRITQV